MAPGGDPPAVPPGAPKPAEETTAGESQSKLAPVHSQEEMSEGWMSGVKKPEPPRESVSSTLGAAPRTTTAMYAGWGGESSSKSVTDPEVYQDP